MRATVMYEAGDVRVEDVPDAALKEPTDALVRVLRSCICGSDLWPCASLPASDHGRRMGHEFLGVVEDTGSEVSGFARGDVVIAPFVWSDGTCDFCREGLQTSCRHGGGWGHDLDGGQGEAARVPQAATAAIPGVGGCWSGATRPPVSWRSTAATPRRPCRCASWSASPAAAGPSKRPSRPARAWPGSTSTRSAARAPDGAGPCWP